jgi:hypothetical protein
MNAEPSSGLEYKDARDSGKIGHQARTTMLTILTSTQLVAILSCALFAGASLYITFVEHPARLACGTELAATVFGPSYRRAAVMQVSLAILGFVGSIAAWLSGAGVSWLVGGLLLALVVPFTLVVIMPTNKQLLAASIDRRAPQTRELLLRWGRLHAVRSGLSFAALVVLVSSI